MESILATQVAVQIVARSIKAEKENARLRAALRLICDVTVPKVPPGIGPQDMAHEAKGYCAALGECITIASEALRVGGK